MYEIISLKNCTILTADMILLCTKNLYLIHDSDSPSRRKMFIGLLVQYHLCPIWPPVLPLNLTYTVQPVLNGPFIKRNLSEMEIFSGPETLGLKKMLNILD
jgi:hypothetical protein